MGLFAAVDAIEYYLPAQVVSNADLAVEFPEWTAEKICSKTGVSERRISAPQQCASDLAFEAAQKLFATGICNANSIDFLLFCSQSPDYFLPTTACLLQARLGIRTTSGALDYNLGCSGFIYGLGLAHGLIASGQAARILLITAETYSKYIQPKDKSNRTIFGDGSAATLLSAHEADQPFVGPFVYGTDGRGGENLIVKAGAARAVSTGDTSAATLSMDGAELFAFTLATVPDTVQALLAKARLSLDDIGLFVFHQATKTMLDHLRKKMNLASEKFVVSMSHCGNTVSSAIPIAFSHAIQQGRLRSGMLVMLVGFGVGYSWGATIIRWR